MPDWLMIAAAVIFVFFIVYDIVMDVIEIVREIKSNKKGK